MTCAADALTKFQPVTAVDCLVDNLPSHNVQLDMLSSEGPLVPDEGYKQAEPCVLLTAQVIDPTAAGFMEYPLKSNIRFA